MNFFVSCFFCSMFYLRDSSVFHCVLSHTLKKLILTLMDIWLVSRVENGLANVPIDVFWCSHVPILKVHF